MSKNIKKVYFVLCEGSSERAYIQELNRYFNRENYPFTLVPKSLGGGAYKLVIKRYKLEKKENKRIKFLIWIDKDIYKRNDNRNQDQYLNKPKNIPNFYFSYMNFEDFLSLHNSEWAKKWREICEERNHFEYPMYEREYLPLWLEHIKPYYKKGELPFPITSEVLNCLFENVSDEKDQEHFAYFLKQLCLSYLESLNS